MGNIWWSVVVVEHVSAPGRNYKPRSAHLKMIEKISPDGKTK
jgi:hypothetical protein